MHTQLNNTKHLLLGRKRKTRSYILTGARYQENKNKKGFEQKFFCKSSGKKCLMMLDF